jgi:hypothetical protein
MRHIGSRRLSPRIGRLATMQLDAQRKILVAQLCASSASGLLKKLIGQPCRGRAGRLSWQLNPSFNRYCLRMGAEPFA